MSQCAAWQKLDRYLAHPINQTIKEFNSVTDELYRGSIAAADQVSSSPRSPSFAARNANVVKTQTPKLTPTKPSPAFE
eukprot:CAMPEP_0119101120 /NCGR_PEP_ID=MMETSP1180-20130426/255_1 /TAXON_ID=3052 ORGANISM="Chlamydomonas cf sp, Strain CCMP681" /NCGR_SAMPLE_ID=MMETSP1180 /ASSEMBLY_ACC=CAM_ASM_000741 /LENGTH=77 /DNA_ID=CAMNT_0007085179 /DNA_START=295 /DNA_END=528 /DNA_ORIENTATION=+